MRRSRWTPCLLALGFWASACAADSHRDLVAARARYERCVSDQGAARCAAEQQRLEAVERRYEDEARRAWGCDPVHEDCPTKR